MNASSAAPNPDRLYELLPAVYRLRDAELGQPLRALLQVIAEQVNAMEADIAGLYDNWFIETCQDWVVPFIGDLISYTPAHAAGTALDPRETALQNKILFPRRDVAEAIASRRRKGALALLEELAFTAAGWPARAVEFYTLLSRVQSLNHLRLERGQTLDIRHGDALDRIDGPFDECAHTVSVARINAARARSRYNIPSVGLFVWRLKPYSLTRTPANCIDPMRNQYTFSILGNNTPLITRPVREEEPTSIAGELNVPAFIRRRAFEDRLADYYGPGKSLMIFRDSLDAPVPLQNVVAADLSDWTYRPQGDQVAVDPVLGRMVFSARNSPEEGVWVTYHYGFSADMGGGEYDRQLPSSAGKTVYTVQPGQRIMATVDTWRAEKAQDPSKQEAIIELIGNADFQEQIIIRMDDGDRLTLRAAAGSRPIIRLLDLTSNRADEMRVRGARLEPADPEALQPPCDAPPSPDQLPRLLIDGLLVAGRSLRITGRIGHVTLRHCTLVPGWTLDPECEPEHMEEPSLVLENTSANVLIDHTILGSILVNQDEVETDPLTITLQDSILDSTGPELWAVSGVENRYAHAILTFLRCTVFGVVRAHALLLAENSIFNSVIRVARRQIGCMRFSYAPLPPASRTPIRYNCQPESGIAALGIPSGNPEPPRLRPQFNSTRYGTPTYCQLAETCPSEIRRGADDESEMGAFHDLYQPQREDNLLSRLAEYTPSGMDAGIIFAS
jgi:hypothetical protein